MSCKLVEKENLRYAIPMCELPAGKIGIIVENQDGAGYLVQKADNPKGGYIILGFESCMGTYSNFYSQYCTLLVRVLQEGELIEVKYT